MPVGSPGKGYEAISIKPLHIKGAVRLYFNSIITEYSDSWSPQWSPTNVYGRMDPVSTYGGTSRELTLGFRVVSDSAEEARQNMIKIEKLVQYQYPSYQNASGGTKIMNSPPYFEFTFLNLLNSTKTKGSRLTGYINGAVQINPGFQAKEQAQFFNPGFTKIYFSDVTITLRLQVLHEGAIGWTSKGFSHTNYPYNVGSDDAPLVETPVGDGRIQQDGAVNANDADTSAVLKTKPEEKKDKNKSSERAKNIDLRRDPARQRAAARLGASQADVLLRQGRREVEVSITRPARED